MAVAGMLLFGVARADCIDIAAHRYGVSADVLRSIAWYESHLNPAAVHLNANGTVDLGLMQINSIHFAALKKEGIDRAMLTNACVNAGVGASYLRSDIEHYGSTWISVGEYHSHTPQLSANYARAIHSIFINRPWERKCVTRSAHPVARPIAGPPSFSVTAISAG